MTRAARHLRMLVTVLLLGSPAAAALAAGGRLSVPPPPPARVSDAITKTEDAAFLRLAETIDGGETSDVVDTRDDKAEVVAGGTIALIEIGHYLYTPGRRKSGCFVRAYRRVALLPDIAPALLPSSENGLVYRLGRHSISWKLTIGPKGHPNYHPFGSVTLDSTGRIVASLIYQKTTLLLRATISYPHRAPKITAPKKVC